MDKPKSTILKNDRMKKLVFIYLSLLILFPKLALPQELVWKHTGGPMGGIIGGMDINSEGEIYAGVYPFSANYTGLYKSTDNGTNWNKIETQFEDFEVFSVYITSKDHIWVGTDHQGRIYRSTDNGQSWENKINGYGSFECWAIGESNEGVLFAGDANSGWLYRSTNNGDSWEFSANFAPLAFAVDFNNVVYAGTFNGLYSTTDNGVTWLQNNFLYGITVSSVIVDKDNNIFCGTGYYNNGNGVYYSNSNGQNWTQIGLKNKVVLSLSFDSQGNLFAGTLKDGLYKTPDLGQNWTQYQNGIYKKQVFRLKINKQDDIFIGSEGGGTGWMFYGGGGVFKSTNGGNNFKQVGLPLSLVKNFVFSGDSLIISSTTSGVQTYNRVTKKWKNIGLHGVEAVTITPSNILYAATREEGLFKSEDLGYSWSLTNLTVDTLMPLYNVLAVNEDTLFASTFYNLKRSTDGGQTWDSLPINTGDNSRGLFFYNNTLWLTGVNSGSGVLYNSTDFGASFHSLYSGFGSTNNSNNSIAATNNGFVYFANRNHNLNGIVRSTDDGQNWEQVLFKRVATIFSNENALVITGSLVTSISDTNKIYISSNHGITWASIVQPTKFGTFITDVKQDSMNNFFFGTSGEGIFEVDIITNIEEETFLDYNFDLSQNYPNPFNPSTTIKYQIPKNGFVSLKVYDILGKVVATLVNEEKVAGIYELNFNASSLASGVYLYRLNVNDYVVVKKMILLH